MNVANVLSLAGFDSGLTVQPGKAAGIEPDALGTLFALQMNNAWLSIQTAPDESQASGQPNQDKTADKLDDLLAMLQQLLATSMQQTTQPVQPDGDAPQVAQIGQQEDAQPAAQTTAFVQPTLLFHALPSSNRQTVAASGNVQKWEMLLGDLKAVADQYGIQPDQTATGGKSLTATFMQQGMAPAKAEALASLLLAMGKMGEEAGQPTIRELGQQVKQLLTALADTEETAPSSTDEQTGVQEKTPVSRVIAGVRPAVAVSRQVVTQSQHQVQPIRLHQALSSYQAESAVAPRVSRTVALAQVNLAPVMTTGDETRSEAVPNVQPTVNATPQPVYTEQTPGRPGGGYHVRAEQFARDVSNLFVKQMKIGTADGVSVARLILHPQSLGQVEVKITAHNGVITAQFSADTASGKELLDNQLGQLRLALTQQGLQVERLEVAQQQNVQQPLGYQQQKEQGRQPSSGRQQPREQRDDEQAEFSLEALLENIDKPVSNWNRLRTAAGIHGTA